MRLAELFGEDQVETAQELAMVMVGFWQRDPGRARLLYDAYRDSGGPGRIAEPGDFTMALAQFGHFALTAARRWLDTTDPDHRARCESWFREGWDDPFGRSEIATILDALD